MALSLKLKNPSTGDTWHRKKVLAFQAKNKKLLPQSVDQHNQCHILGENTSTRQTIILPTMIHLYFISGYEASGAYVPISLVRLGSLVTYIRLGS